ncbi:MAG TPA: phosphodiester glycosidase family protein [Kofleriaceae bacterium]|nr:phosphodiester glycosidase family protein [Kofleriaceae bacterium]
MRSVLSFMLCVAAIGLASTAAHAQDTWSDPHPGMRRLHRTTADQNINVLVVDLCASGVSVRATKTGERQRTVSSFGALVGAEAAINGDFFSFETYGTNGPAMSGGAAWGGTDHNYVAPVQFGAYRVALPPHEATGGVEPWAREVVSGHPTLLVAGAPRNNNGDTLCTARHPRTALGLSADKEKLFLAVVDGRATGRIGMTCDELGALLEGLGASDAVNLDGGGSSTMWLAGTGVLNFPSDGAQRVVANHLAINATGTGAAPNCPHPKFAATFVGSEAPMEMTSGDEAVVFLEATNDGNASWDITQTRVGTQDPQDRDSAFFKAENWIAPNRPTGADHTYAPGATGRFTWAMVAPEVEKSTMFDETFQLVHEGVAWFGEKRTMTILVHPRSGPTTDDGDGSGSDDAPSNSGCNAADGSPTWPLVMIVLLAYWRRPRPDRLDRARR